MLVCKIDYSARPYTRIVCMWIICAGVNAEHLPRDHRLLCEDSSSFSFILWQNHTHHFLAYCHKAFNSLLVSLECMYRNSQNHPPPTYLQVRPLPQHLPPKLTHTHTHSKSTPYHISSLKNPSNLPSNPARSTFAPSLPIHTMPICRFFTIIPHPYPNLHIRKLVGLHK